MATAHRWFRKLLLGAAACLALGCDDERASVPLRIESAPASDAARVSLFERGQTPAALRRLREVLGGPVNTLRLEIDSNRLVIQVQNPIHPSQVDQYEYRHGQLAPAVPVALGGQGDLERNLFPVGDLALEELPTLLALARSAVDSQNGEVERVVVRRNLPQASDVKIRVYVASPGFDGYADFDAKGRATSPRATP